MWRVDVVDGGYIKIKRINITKSNYIMHIINSIGDRISSRDISIFLSNLVENDVLKEKDARLIKAATNDNVLQIDAGYKDYIRANIFKNMLVNLVED